MGFAQKLSYCWWAALHQGREVSCPVCGSQAHTAIKRKFITTRLFECDNCGLLYRVPKSTEAECATLYNDSYEQGFTTDMPGSEELTQLKETNFVGTTRDYGTYISCMRAAGVPDGSSVYEMGCSWGYGSWQLRRAGYRVYSSELGKPRADYARVNLDCAIVNDVEHLPEKVDCFFSSHVIEHLPNPQLAFSLAKKALKPGGLMVTFMPNGDKSSMTTNPDYHKHWGLVHPVMLTSKALQWMAAKEGMQGTCYSDPYDLNAVRQRSHPAQLLGPELLFIAK